MASDIAFAQKYLTNLGNHPVNYGDDFVTPIEKRPRRMPVVGLELADPPVLVKEDASAAASTSQITLTIKSLKPSLTLPLQFPPTESISSLKSLIHQTLSAGPAALPTAPIPATMRLLLKGKALADDKLLKEYEVAEGGVINLMLKAGWEKESSAAAVRTPTETSSDPSVPNITLTNPTSTIGPSVPTINFPSTISDPAPPHRSTNTPYHGILSTSSFWKRIYTVCTDEMESYPTLQGKPAEAQKEANGLWLELFDAMRGRLEAGEIAKIQDEVGVNGMGGV